MNALIPSRRGQSSLEILIALAIFTLGIASLIGLVFGGQSLTADTTEEGRALALARENLENAQALAKNNFTALVSASSTQGGFVRETIVEDLDANTKRVTARVSWQADPLRPRKVELAALVTAWRLSKDTGGDTGGGGTSGDWMNPQTLGSVDLGPGNSATGLDVFQNVVYITAQASDPKKGDFFVVDATNGQSPVSAGSLNTGPGLNAVDAAGGYAYAGNSAAPQLQVIDVSNRASPALAGSLQLAGIPASTAAQSIAYSNGKVYIGTLRSSGAEFHVIDASNPAALNELGRYEVDADVNSIQVVGHYAYIATSDNTEELKILDVTDPASISEAGYWNAPGSEDAKSLYVYGSSLYLGRAAGADPELSILNISNAGAPALLGAHSIGADVNGIRIRDQLAFIGTSDSNKEFQVWNVANPVAVAFWSSFNFPQVATGVDYENNLVYVSVRSNDALRIITSGP